MKNNLLSLVFLSAIMAPSVSRAQSYQLFWSDEFNGTSLDENYWNYETGNGDWGWGTGQLDYDTKRDTNVKVSGGNLIIQTLTENYSGFNYTSGRLTTAKKLSFKHGKVEIRAKVPTGSGEGVAFWMLPTWEKFGGWPRSGEIDILEICGKSTTQSQGTMHFGENGNDVSSYAIYKPTGVDLSADFHVYGVEWDSKTIKWYVDTTVYKTANVDVPYGTQYYFPFSEEFYVIISAGVGAQMCGAPDGSILQSKYVVDYFRVYKTADEIVTIPAKIEAEAYTSQGGTQLETCTDSGGGNDVGQIGTGDFLSYNLVAQQAGVYKVTFRVAAGTGYSGSIKILSGATQVGTINVPTTGGWQTWQDVSTNITLKQGVQNITLNFTGVFNINYVNYEWISTSVNEVAVNSVKLFPNPFSSKINISSDSGEGLFSVYDLSGREVLNDNFKKGNSIFSTDCLSPGIYLIQIKTNSGVTQQKLIKE